MWVIRREIVLILLLAPTFAACLAQKTEMPTHIVESTQDISTPTRDTRKLTPNPGLTATLEAAQTLQAMKDNCEGNPSSYYLHGDESLFISPNKEWQIAYCVHPESELPYTRLLKRQSEKIWDIPFHQGLMANHPEIKDGALRAEKWSEDGKYVYLDSYFCCLDGPGMVFVNTYGLYRVELETAEIKEMLSGGYFTFSPDGANDSGNEIHIYDLENDKDGVIPVAHGYAQIGMFSWSPDGQNIIFVGAFPDWDMFSPDSKQSGFSLLLLNIKTKTVTVLVENDNRFLQPLLYKENDAWVSNDEILLSARDGSTYALNISTEKILLQPTPTLNP